MLVDIKHCYLASQETIAFAREIRIDYVYFVHICFVYGVSLRSSVNYSA